MRLDRLIADVDVFGRLDAGRKLEITTVTEDTRSVQPGALFVCVPGSTRDGHDLAADAVAKGAVALIVERELDIDVQQVRVPDSRAALGPLCAAFYNNPAKYLKMVAVTGTNGKTSVTQLLTHILQRHGWKTAGIGTLTAGQYTTPPPPELQRTLAELRDSRHQAVVMEAASQALVQHRVDGIRFAVGIFTNLTREHLDYHRTMQAYFEAKAMLFEPERCEHAVINVDDEWGRRLVDRAAMPVTEYSMKEAEDLRLESDSSTFVWRGREVRLGLIGEFNVANALAAANAALVLGASVETIVAALSDAAPVSGRMERVDRGQPFTVIVDYAHTPDGLENVLKMVRRIAERNDGRVHVVFGGFGDRDPGKRPQMGLIAEQLADSVVVTTDNPRSEEPAAIAQDVLAGMQHPQDVTLELDRPTAIAAALAGAKRGDVVLIAGKGAETMQEIKGVKYPFDDRIVAAEALERLGFGGAAS